MQKTTLKSKISICFIIFSALLFVGCDGGSNNPVSTGISTGTGYKIQLASSVEMVSVSGSSVITAEIFEPDGSPIRDGEDVLFASSEGGTLSDTNVQTKNGKAVITYTAGDTPMRYDNISASCNGATAIIRIWVIPQTF